jgi:hypothetical protein
MKAADLQGGERIVTIREFKVETLDDAQANKERKVVCYFHEAPKGVVLNKCNALALLELFGSDQLERWNETAKTKPVRVVLFTEQTQLGPGIRLRKAPDQAPPAAPPAPPVPPAAPPWPALPGAPPQTVPASPWPGQGVPIPQSPAAGPLAPILAADPAQMWAAFCQWMQTGHPRT